jgi:Rab5 GDP/GTP exchange factor
MEGEEDTQKHFRELSLDDPWRDESAKTHTIIPLNTPSENAAAAVSGQVTEDSEPTKPSDVNVAKLDSNVLQEFDPLVEEGRTRDVIDAARRHERTGSESQLYDQDLASPSQPIRLASSEARSEEVSHIQADPRAPVPTAGFSLATIARSFSIPKVRTRSIDMAQSTASAIAGRVRGSSLVARNENVRKQNEDAEPFEAVESRISTSNTSSVATMGETERNEPPPFDFQLFLDQMKSRSAEPVAKYLRSCVSATRIRSTYLRLVNPGS